MAIERIAVIGAGTAGRVFALACARVGFNVALEDVMPEKLRRAQDAYASMSETGSGSLRFASTVEDAVVDADMAIDFVPDELESKLEIFCLIDRMAPPRTLIVTPTTALSIGDLASCTYRGDRCVAVRGTSLVAGHVEVVQSALCSTESAEAASAVWRRLACATAIVSEGGA